MKTLDILNKLRETPEFKKWQDKHSEARLVHIFILIDPKEETKYDIGFFDAKKELMTSFVFDDVTLSVEINESNEVFKREEETIKPLDESKIKICFTEAGNTAKTLQQEKYKMHKPLKEIVILQNLPIGQVWNITYITATFQTLNFKIDSETGKVIEDKLHQIFNFDK